MKHLVVSLVLVGCVGCASLNQSAESLTHQAIVESERLHTAHVLTDAQFQATNVQLNTIAVSGREFTKLAAAKQATGTDALKFVLAIEEAISNLRAAPFSGAIGTVLTDLVSLDAKITQYARKF